MLSFNSIENLVTYYINTIDSVSDKFGFVTIVAKRDMTKEIMDILLGKYNFDTYCIKYDKLDYLLSEYLISIDKNYVISITSAKNKGNNEYLYCEAEKFYIHEDISSKFLIKNEETPYEIFEIC